MRASRLLLPFTLVLTLLLAGLSVLSAAPSAAAPITHYPPGVTGGTIDADGRLSNPELASCDVPEPARQFVTFPSYAQTAVEICGIWSLEDAAASAYDQLHGAAADDESVTSALYVEAGYVQNFLQALAYARSGVAANFTADDTGAYTWFLAVQQKYQQTVAADAQREYQEWAQQLCDYRPPSTSLFTYNASSQPVCSPDDNPSLAALFTTVAPPTYANFVEYGRYDAEQELGLTSQATQRADRTLIDNGIIAGAGSLASILAGGAPQLAGELGVGSDALESVMRTLQPHNQDFYQSVQASTRAEELDLQALSKLEEVAELEAGGEEIPAELEAAAEAIAEEAEVEAGVAAEALEEAVATGADLLSAPLAVGTIAVTLAVMRGISVFTAANIPHQLAADVAAADPADTDGFVQDLFTGHGGANAAVVFANYRAQLQFPSPSVGVPTSSGCPGCVVDDVIPASVDNVPARLHITALNADGTPSGWSTTASTATFVDTWGMGAANGASGVPHVSVGIAGDKVWTKRETSSAPTDETEAGLLGWIPSGELHYFNAAGQPMIAYLQGDQFVTQTSPGSVDAAGYDAGDDCSTPGECTTGSSIVVMGSGGTPQLRDEVTQGSFAGIPCSANDPGTHDCFTDTLKANGKLVPANGSTVTTSDGDTIRQTGTSHLYRLTILPDAGTPASVWVTNRYNTWANSKSDGVAPNGGLVAGDTATFTDPENSAAGYDTTYTWQVQTVCPVDPAHPAQTVQGVTVCSDSPDYGKTRLAGDEQDLTSCVATVGTCTPGSTFGVTWTADPAFHGGPVTTLTGRSVDWTWPAPGTYHLRLITTDQYGVTRSSDRDLVVSAASSPRSSLSFASAEDPQLRQTAPSVIGPVKNGNALTVTGCVVSPATIGSTAYATPDVSVDWGDGTEASDGALTFHPGSGCATSWRWTATHTYGVSTLGQPFVQVPITVTTRDVTFPVTQGSDLPPGTRASSAVTLYADVYAPTAPPSFVAGPSTTYDFTAAVGQTVTGYVTSQPNAVITRAAATGVTQDGAACTPGIPSGMGFQPASDNSFEITGTPGVHAGGCYAITVTATNTYGSTDEQVVVDVAQGPRITSDASAGWATSDAHDSVTVATTGFPTPTIDVTGVDCTTGCGSALPPDVSFVDNGDGTATLSADGLSADDTGVYELTLTATSASGTVTQMFTLTIEGLPAFTSADSTGFFTGRAGSFDIGVSSTTPATLTCSLSGSDDQCRSGDHSRPFIDPDLPEGTGLSLVGSTITGIPAESGSYPVTLTATNAVGSTTQHLTILVSASGGATITMVNADDDNLVTYAPTAEPPSGAATFLLGQPGTVTLCSNVPGDTLSTQTVANGHQVTTPLPAGLAITTVANTACPSGDQQLTLGGTPTTPLTTGSAGSTAYRIVDAAGGLALLTLRLVGSPTFSSPSTATFTTGEAGSFTASLGTLRFASGSYSSGCISSTSSLPAGLSLTANPDGTATIAGTPTASGRTTVTLRGTDCNGQSTTQQLTIDVVRAPVLTSAGKAGFQVGAGGTFTVTTDADAFPVPVLQVTGLPRGVTFLDDGDGTGTLRVSAALPATDSPIELSVEASSSSGTDTQPLRLAVGVAPTITSAAGATLVLARGRATSYDVETSGVPTATLTADDFPAGLDLTDNGDGTATLSGTPTTLGETTVTVSAANGIGSAATTTLDVLVVDAADFAGTTTGDTCGAASPASTHHRFVAGDSGTWTICGTGSPTPAITVQSVTCGGSTTNLPAGLTFTDRGDGSATIAGSAAIGSGAACPDGYTVSVALANAGGTVVQDLTLDVREVIESTTPTTTDSFVPGAANAAVLGAAGSPTPAFALDAASSLPAWLTLTDQGNGTASVSGTPPPSAAGTSVTFTVDVTNDDAAPLVEEVTVPVSTIGLTAASPPTAHLGVAYDYQFGAPSGVRFSLADGGALPDGLTLSASGRLAGTPTELGRFPVALALASGGTTVTTGTIDLKVGVGEDALEISQFRTIAPGDWFVQVVNTTAATIPLAGWHVGLQQPGSTASEQVPLGTGTLAPGATAVVTTAASSLRSQLDVTSFAAPVVPVGSGFEVVAPNGLVTDAAGVVGALPDLREGTGVAYPSPLTQADAHRAFVRRGFRTGEPVDTDDNAADFTFATVAGVADTLTVNGTPGDDAVVGGTGTFDITDSLGAGVAYASRTPAVCSVDGPTVTYLHVGTCTVRASGDGDVFQDFSYDVGKASQAIALTSVPPATAYVGATYTVVGTGGPSGNPVTYASTTPGVCSVAGATVTFRAAGTCTVAADQAGDADHAAAPQVTQSISVARVGSTVRVGFDVLAPVFGQPVTATATVTGAAAGAVQFAVDGVATGAPVVTSGGTASSGPLAGLSVGDHVVTAAFTPTDQVTYDGASDAGTVVVGRAATTTEVTVSASALTATVAAVAPGAGQPAGTVTFLLDGAEVGTAPLDHGVATLEHRTSGGATHVVAGSYGGSESFAASSGSTARHDPVITAQVASAKPRSRAGWYRTPVTVTFTCATTGAPLAAPCPGPVTLSRDGAAQTVSRTVSATDGGLATVTVTPVNIDQTPPVVRIRGVHEGATYDGRAPRATCVAHDALSGVGRCTVTHTTHGHRVVYTAVATDRAGNTNRTRVKVRAANPGTGRLLRLFTRPLPLIEFLAKRDPGPARGSDRPSLAELGFE